MNSKILISKDAVCCDYLPVYGNSYWKTPNIDALAEKGTVFLRHYTSAPSTAMAFTGIATGLYGFETGRKTYTQVKPFQGKTLFDAMHIKGYECHIAWDKSYTRFAEKYFQCQGKDTKIHSLDSIIPSHCPHINGEYDDLTYFPEKERQALQLIYQLFEQLTEKKKPVFLWLHLPHVLNGRNSYNSDIDLWDEIVGYARSFFGDENIYITSDHGNMDGCKGKFGYGFDVEEAAIKVPFITPKINGQDIVEFPTSHTQLTDIICHNRLIREEFMYSETAYYVQPTRKVAIIHGDYKFIYDKKNGKKYLYDLKWDAFEKYNLYYPEFYDIDRKTWYSLNQRFLYPYWKTALKEKSLLEEQWKQMWCIGNPIEELKENLIFHLKYFLAGLKNKLNTKKKIVNIGK